MASLPSKQRKKKLNLRQLRSENVFFVPYASSIETLNNIFLTTTLAKKGLTEIRENLKSKDPHLFEIEIPTIKGNIATKTTDKSKVVEILKSTIKRDLYSNSIVAAISITESFLEQVVRAILTMHPGKLSADVERNTKKEAADEKKIDLKDILSANSLSDIYDKLIMQKVVKLFYASPTEYFKYLSDTIQITLDQDTIGKYVEIKATRDLITHNKGQVNQIYLDKTEKYTRVKKLNQNIPITEEYFKNSIGTMKLIVKSTYEIASAKYLKISNKGSLYPRSS
jgi:hypothetical protein